jgi:DNA-binding ferritin-like protein
MITFREYLKQVSSEQIEKSEINEAINIETLQQSGVNYIVCKTLALASQVHIWHLLAKSGQKHTALGTFYTALETEVDGLAEKFLAIGGILEDYSYNLISTYSDVDITIAIRDFRDHVSNTIANIKLDSNLESILDSLTDLQEAIDNFSYQFKLD